MRLTDRVHLVASGASGFDLTDRWDAHAYLVDGGEAAALVDVGLGRGVDELLGNVAAAGVAPGQLSHCFVTPAHPDHCGAAATLARRLPGLRVAASPEVAAWLRDADRDAMSLEVGVRAEFWPPDFDPEPCEVAVELADGDRVRVGEVEVESVATPGHAAGHRSYLLDDAPGRALFGGDLVFSGGRISLLNTWDCDLAGYATSITRFRGAAVDALLPGHHSVTLADGQRHLDAAIRRLDAGFVPPSIV